MKRILSIILAIAMIATFIPAVSATGTDVAQNTGEHNIRITYDLAAQMDSLGLVWKSGVPLSKITYDTTNGFFKFVGGSSDVHSASSDYVRYYWHNIGIRENRYVAFEVYVPKAGTYTMKMENGVGSTGNVIPEVSVYRTDGKYDSETFAPTGGTFEGTYSCVDDTVAAGSQHNNPLTADTAREIPGIEIPEAGYYVFSFVTGSEPPYYYGSVGSFTLVSGDGTEVAPMNAALDISNGIASVTKVVMSDGSVLTAEQAKEKGATITYESSDTTKATVDATTGKITDIEEGESTITATITLNGVVVKAESKYTALNANLGITVKYDVSAHLSALGLNWTTQDYNGAKLPDLTYDYTNGFYKYATSSTWFDKSSSRYYFYSDFNSPPTNCNIVMRRGYFTAFEVDVPVAGIYTMKVSHGFDDNDGWIVNVYKQDGAYNETAFNISEISNGAALGGYNCTVANDKGFTSLMESNVKTTGVDKMTLTENDSLVRIENPGKYVFVFHVYHPSDIADGWNRGSVGSFALISGGSGNAIIDGKITKLSDALTVGGDTATVTAEGYLSATTEKATFTYTSNNTDVATVDAATGVVTPVGAGTATITATCADAIINNVLTTEVTVEKAQIGEELDSTVQVYIDALTGGSVTKSTSNTIDNVTPGTLVTVEAIADADYAFSHWQDSEGKYVSDSSTYSFRPYVNTSVIAVFDKTTVADGDTKTVYFYNGNGEYVTEKTTTESTIEMPANATLTGYIFDKWTVDGVNVFDGTNIIKAVTRVVAQYQEKGKEYSTLKINNTDTVIYDTAKIFSDENATHWKRDGKTVAYGKEYKHYMWDAATIEAGTGNVEKIPVILLDEHSVENDFYMIEYDLPEGYTKLEAGILFGDATHNTVGSCYYKAKSTNKPETAEHGQFTAKPSTDTTKTWNVVRGYLVYNDGTENRVIYADLIN